MGSVLLAMKAVRSWKGLALLAGIGLVGAAAAVFHLGTILAQPVHRPVGDVPQHPPFVEVQFESRSGSALYGWFARAEPSKGSVALLHGVRADRRSMLGRAEFLYDEGYSVLLFDFQAHGESEGERITFGQLEALDARSAVKFLKQQSPGDPVAAIGTSLGGAACVLGPEPLEVDAIVLEAVYPDVRQAIRNRLRIRFGSPGAWLEPLLSLQLKPRMGIDPKKLRPVDAIGSLRAPVLLVAGESDRRTTVAEVRESFDAAPDPKEMWTVAGAAHVDFHRHSKDAYEATVLEFLQRYMRRTS